LWQFASVPQPMRLYSSPASANTRISKGVWDKIRVPAGFVKTRADHRKELKRQCSVMLCLLLLNAPSGLRLFPGQPAPSSRSPTYQYVPLLE
jgi:hypothetical protein